MKITICSSLSFIKEITEINTKLIKLGHEVKLPRTAELVINGELTQEQIIKEKKNGEFLKRFIEYDAIRLHNKHIKNSDAILILNFDKNGIKNYIGGAVFLELGFAHVNNKKIFMLNDIPEISYKEEILAMQPIIIKGDLNKVK